MSNNIFFERGQMADKPNNYLWNGDCLELMQDIPDKSMDAIICDLPYGTTKCKWDIVIHFEPLWEQYNRIIKDNGAIVLFGGEPFSSRLRLSNINDFRYDWIWDKVQPTGAVTAKKRPMQLHEYISVFYKKYPTYNRQMSDRPKKDIRKNAVKNKENQKDNFGYVHLGGTELKYAKDYDPTKVNPKTIIRFTKQPTRKKNLHPTQKPLDLLKYLVKTYTNENDWVLDNTCGSNTTGVACYDLNRNYIGIEKDIDIYNVAKKRVEENILLRANKQETLFDNRP